MKYNKIKEKDFFNNNLIFYNENLDNSIVNLKENFLKSITLEYLYDKETPIIMISNNSNNHYLFTKLHNFINLNILQSASYIFFKEINKQVVDNILNIILELYIYKKYFYDNEIIDEKIKEYQNIIFNKREEVTNVLKEKKVEYQDFYYINIKNLLVNEDLEEIGGIFDLSFKEYLDILEHNNINLIINSLKDEIQHQKGVFDHSIFLEADILSYNIRQLKFNLNIVRGIQHKISLYFNSFNTNSNYFNPLKFMLIFDKLNFFINKNKDIFYFKIPVIGFNVLNTLHEIFNHLHENYLINLADINLSPKLNTIVIKILRKTSYIIFSKNSINYMLQEKIEEFPLDNLQFLKTYMLYPDIKKEKFIKENYLILKIIYNLLDVKDILKFSKINNLNTLIKLLENYYEKIQNDKLDIENFIELLKSKTNTKKLNKIEELEKVVLNENFVD